MIAFLRDLSSGILSVNKAMGKVETKPPLPRVEIVEQPHNTRFRYGSEKKLRRIPGSTENTFPAIRISNYRGPLKVIVSCVTKDAPYKPHPHRLYNGKDKFKHGVCCIREDMYTGDNIIFDNLTVECVSKKSMAESLSERSIIKVDPFNTGYDVDFNEINLNCVRLCFQVTLESPSHSSVHLEPIVSEPFFNAKGAPGLDICWLTRHSATVAGGAQLCILCEKVSRNDIEVRFSHEDSNWEAVGKFTGPSVFKQVAIVVETPEYRTDKFCPASVREPLQVNVQLRRPSDGEIGDPRPFLLLPIKADPYQTITDDTASLKRKRDKYKKGSSLSVSQTLQAAIEKNRDQQFNNVTCELWELPPAPSFLKRTESSFDSKQFRLFEHSQGDSGINFSSEKSIQDNLLTDSIDRPKNVLIPCKITNEVSKQFSLYKSMDTHGNNSDIWIQDLLDVIKDDLDSTQNVSNSTIKQGIMHGADTDFLNLSLEASSSLASLIDSNSTSNSAVNQLGQFFHNDIISQGSNCLNDLDNICFSDLIPDLNYQIEDFYSNTKEAVAVNMIERN